MQKQDDTIYYELSIGPDTIKAAQKGERQRILFDDKKEYTNSNGDKVIITVRVETKPTSRMKPPRGNGLTGKKLDYSPHRNNY